MTDDPFLNFIIGVTCCGALGLVWAMSSANIAHDCKTMGTFRVNDTVYECRKKQ